MNFKWVSCLFFVSLFNLTGEESVELSGVHLCCNGCVKAIDKAVEKTGAKSTCDKSEKTVTVTAKDAASMKKALAAVAKSGYYGESKGQFKVIQEGAIDKKVKKVSLGGFHNCCGKCTTGMSKAVEAVKGVKNHTIAKKKRDFMVEGDFNLNELLKSINEHGFSVSVK
jgi:copper chaperone CopZ